MVSVTSDDQHDLFIERHLKVHLAVEEKNNSDSSHDLQYGFDCLMLMAGKELKHVGWRSLDRNQEISDLHYMRKS
nr:hypothetical protein BgiMline_034115 [Biomphalaria glabrata]